MDQEKFQELVLEQLKIMNERFNGIDKRFESIDQRFEKIEKQVEEVKTIQLRMEKDLGEKIAALFDGYSLREDQINRTRAHFDRRLDDISDDIRYLMKKYVKHDEELQELRRAK